MHENNKFSVLRNGKKTEIASYDTNSLLRKMSSENLKRFLGARNRLLLKEMKNQNNESEYRLDVHGELKGGGPIAGAIGYWLTKGLGYGVVIGGIGGTIAATGGAAAGGLAATAGTAIATAGGVTGAAATTATIVSGTIAGSAAATEVATMATMSAVTTGGVVATIETASTSVGAALTICPFLP